MRIGGEWNWYIAQTSVLSDYDTETFEEVHKVIKLK